MRFSYVQFCKVQYRRALLPSVSSHRISLLREALRMRQLPEISGTAPQDCLGCFFLRGLESRQKQKGRDFGSQLPIPLTGFLFVRE